VEGVVGVNGLGRGAGPGTTGTITGGVVGRFGFGGAMIGIVPWPGWQTPPC
jgi:hypothetical protein